MGKLKFNRSSYVTTNEHYTSISLLAVIWSQETVDCSHKLKCWRTSCWRMENWKRILRPSQALHRPQPKSHLFSSGPFTQSCGIIFRSTMSNHIQDVIFEHRQIHGHGVESCLLARQQLDLPFFALVFDSFRSKRDGPGSVVSVNPAHFECKFECPCEVFHSLIPQPSGAGICQFKMTRRGPADVPCQLLACQGEIRLCHQRQTFKNHFQ